jgi:hypothetical protein
MQLARLAYTRLQRQHKQAHPLYPLLPDFKGTAALSTGALPIIESKPSVPNEVDEPGEGFQPLETSSAWKKWCKIEHDKKIIAQEVSRRLQAVAGVFPTCIGAADTGELSQLRAVVGPASADPNSSLLDEELEP